MAAAANLPSRPAILLVDDDPFMLELESGTLRGMGYTDVSSLGDARAALAALLDGGQSPDVIICDLNMPGMDGVQFLQALNASAFAVSVILLSGEGARILHTVQKLLSGGQLTVLGALEKPGRPEALRALLECWVPRGTPTPIAHTVLPVTVEAVLAAAHEKQWLLHYQPKIDLASGALSGVEALVRWNHPQHGLVYPDSFIGIAEECGAIGALTEWVLCESVDQLARWTAQGLRVPVAINVSMDNLCVPDFATRVATIVRERGVRPQDVTLEVTESRAMSLSMAPLECLVRLRLFRFKLAIDDFGTGHSSLAQLRDVPFTELKVDRGFVHGACRNQIIRPMLDGSVGLAKRLGMASVAEGVENEEDLALLREIGCDFAQGYFIGRPMEVANLAAWMSDWHVRRAQLFGL
jgi:EAL domain-containing protein (putative c-di-GMP-specific phosphodiesterase class I)/CheY-like chemotaxis protein